MNGKIDQGNIGQGNSGSIGNAGNVGNVPNVDRRRGRRTALLGAFSIGVLIAGGLLSPQRPAAGTVVRGTTRTTVTPRAAVNHNVVAIHRDIDSDVDHDYQPVARPAAPVPAEIGSVVHRPPPACQAVVVEEMTYQQCGSVWYQPHYVGSQINYVVVDPPLPPLPP